MVQNTARKMSKYGVFSGPYFPVFGQYSIQVRENTDQKKTPYQDSFHAVEISVMLLVERSEIQLLMFHSTRKKTNFEVQTKSNVNSTLVARFEIRFCLCFLTSKKEDNTVQLRQSLEIFHSSLVEENAFRLHREWNKLMIKQ